MAEQKAYKNLNTGVVIHMTAAQFDLLGKHMQSAMKPIGVDTQLPPAIVTEAMKGIQDETGNAAVFKNVPVVTAHAAEIFENAGKGRSVVNPDAFTTSPHISDIEVPPMISVFPTEPEPISEQLPANEWPAKSNNDVKKISKVVDDEKPAEPKAHKTTNQKKK